jgi:hypothetical protein
MFSWVLIPTEAEGIVDSSGNSVKATIESIQVLTEDGPARASFRQNSQENIILPEGKYTIELKPEIKPIKSIKIYELKTNGTIDLGIDDVPETGENSKWAEVYAIDPTKLEFENATVTAVAKGTELWKCSDWAFEEQRCAGEWAKLMDIIPGEEYSFTLTQDDPGFAEINITNALHLNESYGLISSIYDEVRLLDNIWSEPVYENEYVRVTFEQNLTAENDITVYVRNNQSLNTKIQVYKKNDTEIITDFGIITATGKYQTYLIGMDGSSDTFDLKIVNYDNEAAYLEFDHIVDPSVTVANTDTWRFESTSNTRSGFECNGDNRLIVVSYSMLDTGSDKDINSVTYGGQSLTKLDDNQYSGGPRVEVWYLVNPPSGSNSIATSLTPGGNKVRAGAICYNNVDQINPTNAKEEGSGKSTTTSRSVASESGDLVQNVIALKGTYSLSPGAGQTERWDGNVGGGGARGGASTKPGNASVTMSWSWSTEIEYAHIAFNINHYNNKPTHATPILNSTLGTNTTDENLTCYNQSTNDADGDHVKNIFNWYRNGSSISALNMPFEGGSNSTYTKDYSGYSNDGTVYNAVWNSTGGYDGFGAYEFDGNWDYIMVKNNSVLNSLGSASNPNYTIAFWWKTNPGVTGYNHFISKLGTMPTDPGPSPFEFYLKGSDYRISFAVKGASNRLFLNVPNIIYPEKWYFIVGVREENVARLYVNGTEVLNGTTTFGDASNTQQITIGQRGDNSTWANGTIDDVRVYDYALSPEQIKALYNSRTDLIVSNATSLNDVWQCCVTPNDGYQDGTELCSNNLTIIEPSAPGLEMIWLDPDSDEISREQNQVVETSDKSDDELSFIQNIFGNILSIFTD